SMILDGIIPATAAPDNSTSELGGTQGQLTLVEDQPNKTETGTDNTNNTDEGREADPFERARPHLNLILTPDTVNNPDDPDAVAYTLDGAPVPASLATELICSAQINAWVLTADRKHLDLGFDAELATTDQKIALAIRDQTCRWKRCTREGSRCEAHHLKHREHAGPTNLNNLALLCPYHHDRLHQLKLHLRMGQTADHWLLKDIHGQTVDQWTKPTPPWANPRDSGDPNADPPETDEDPATDAA
ncbi:MAG: HNH endonuclease, partial [Actinomycetia bacterium]|nr:HNH endonuclease [Actinomycetes bacterium]